MTQNPDLYPVLLQIIWVVFTLLTALLAWIGVRIHNRLDDICQSLSKIERDLRDDLAHLDRRVTRIEEHCSAVHRVTI